MRPRSKFNEPERVKAVSLLVHDLIKEVSDGKGIITTARGIIRKYIDAGYDIDAEIISDILGIDSETDDMDVQSEDGALDFYHVFLIYNGPFGEARRAIYDYISENKALP